MNEHLDKFGAFFVQNLRDRILSNSETLLRGGWKAPALQKLQTELAGFSESQKQTVRELVERIATSGMHDLLFAIQEQADADGEIKVMVDGEEIAELSDGLHGELFGDDGWIVRFSKFPSPVEIDSSKQAKEQIQKLQEGNESIG